MKKITFFFVMFFSGSVFADGGYKCQIIQAQNLKGSGLFEKGTVYDSLIGKEFFVDKGTGRMTGAIKNHATSAQPQILDYGSKEQAYKVITIYKPNVAVDYLRIAEFEASEKKPFFYVAYDNIISGICTVL